MRLHYVVLLAIAASNAVALSATTNSKLVASDLPERSRSITEGQHEAPNRHLREEDTTEERAFSIKAIPGLEKFKSIPGFDKFKGLFKTKVTLGTLLGWAKKGKSPDKVFAAYKLDKTGTKLFESPDFKIWYTYTALVTKTDPEKAVLTSLVGRFGESTVSSMLEGAMKVSGTKEIATALQMKQMESWNDLGMSAGAAFKFLDLGKNVDTVLTNPNLNAWTKYVDDFTVKKNLDTPLIDALRANYDDAALVKMFNVAKNNAQTKTLATNLEDSLLNKLRLHRMKQEQLRHATGN